MKKAKTGFEIEIKSFTSDRLIQKIDAYNQKKSLNGSKKDLFEENGEENGNENEEENGNGKRKTIYPY